MLIEKKLREEKVKVEEEIRTGIIAPERFMDYARCGITDIHEYKKQLDEILRLS